MTTFSGDASTTFSGDAGDIFKGNKDKKYHHQGMMFSAKDLDNDKCQCNCAQLYGGGWWYNRCYAINLNGPQYKVLGVLSNKPYQYRQLQKSRMMVRPSD